MRNLILVLPALLLLAACGQPRVGLDETHLADSAAEANATSETAGQAQQREFMEAAYRIHETAIRTGEEAYQRSADPQVRALGLKIATEHQAWLSRLEKIAAHQNIRLRASAELPDGQTDSRLMELRLLDGADFDRRIIQIEMDDQARAADWFAHAGGDPAFSHAMEEYARSIQPVLQQLQSLAASIDRNIA